MRYSLTVVCKILIISVAGEKHILVEESLVDREDLGYGVDKGQAQRAVRERLTSGSLKDGEGSCWELADVYASGYAVGMRAGNDVCVVCEAVVLLVKSREKRWRFYRFTLAPDHKNPGSLAPCLSLRSPGCWLCF